MKISGAHTLPVDQSQAYKALQDPEVLAKAMPGCDELEQIAEDSYRMKMKLLLASLPGLFDGEVRIADRNPPDSFTLIVEGKGKAGFVKGQGVLHVTQSDAGTEVRYDGDVHVGGTIASVGQRLIDATARSMIRRFFENLTAELTRRSANAT